MAYDDDFCIECQAIMPGLESEIDGEAVEDIALVELPLDTQSDVQTATAVIMEATSLYEGEYDIVLAVRARRIRPWSMYVEIGPEYSGPMSAASLQAETVSEMLGVLRDEVARRIEHWYD